MSEDQKAPPRFESEVTFSVTFKQRWTSPEADCWAAKKNIEDFITTCLKSGKINQKTLNRDLNGRHSGITVSVGWPIAIANAPKETIQEERLRAMNDEIDGELTIVDCTVYEVEA